MIYRIPSKVEAETPKPLTLVYEALDRTTTTSSAVIFFRLVSIPASVGILLALTVNGTASVIGIVASFAFALRSNRSNRERATLTIDGGELTIVHGRKKRGATIPLAEVRNVELDIKKIRRVQEGTSLVPGAQFINTTVGPEIDTARIAIVFGTERVFLSETYVAHIDAVEWLGKIRIFLRSGGWAPEDELPPVEEESDAATYPPRGAGA